MFVVLTRGRSGSTALCDSLTQLDRVLCFQELLRLDCPPLTIDGVGHGGVWYGLESACWSYSHQFELGIRIEEWWERLRGLKSEKGLDRLGLKVLFRDLDTWGSELYPLIDSALILLLVRNPFFEGVSAVAARTSGVWDSLHLGGTDLKPIRLDPSEVKDEMKYSIFWNKRVRQFLDERRAKFLELEYRDCDAEPIDFDPILKFLELAPQVVSLAQSRTRKLLHDPANQIVNWCELTELQMSV